MSISVNRNVPLYAKKQKIPKQEGGGGGGDLPLVQRKILEVTLHDWPTSSIAAGASTEQTWLLSVRKILAAVGYTVTEDQLTTDRNLTNAKLLPTPYTISIYHPRKTVNASQHKADVDGLKVAFGSKYGLITGARTGENVAAIELNATMTNISSSGYSPSNVSNASKVENNYVHIMVDAIVPASSGAVATKQYANTSTLLCD